VLNLYVLYFNVTSHIHFNLFFTDPCFGSRSVAAVSTGSIEYGEPDDVYEEPSPTNKGYVDLSFYDRNSSARNKLFCAPPLLVLGDGEPVVAVLPGKRVSSAVGKRDEERKWDKILDDCLEVKPPLYILNSGKLNFI
jgi:hypothetical protein